MKLIRVGIDLAKNVFQVHGLDRNEKAVWRRKLTRESWLKVLLETVEPGCEIGMESCGGAHHWARRLQAHGFKVRMIAPQFVKPYVKSNKNDANDAEAICEAMSRRHMPFVAVNICRPSANCSPLPTAATSAVAVIGRPHATAVAAWRLGRSAQSTRFRGRVRP